MNCPKCESVMDGVTFDGVEVDRCRQCAGIWFDMLEHEKLKGKHGSEAIDTGNANLGLANNAMKKVDCPRCHTGMVRMVDREQPHIWYEQCSTCGGVYFDAGEFKDFKSHTLGDLIRAWRVKTRG